MASDPGFTDEIYQVTVTPGSQWLQVMYAKYEANLNIDGTGAIVAAPDLETPGMARISLVNLSQTGGSYYYHWMRDAGLSIKAWMDINDNDYERVTKTSLSPIFYCCTYTQCRDALDGYVKWTGIVQHKTDANCDVR